MNPFRKLFERRASDPNKKPIAKRMVIMLVGVGVLLGGVVGFNLFKGYMMGKYMASQPTPPATVTATKADFQQWQSALNAVGTLRAVRGVDVTLEDLEPVRGLLVRPRLRARQHIAFEIRQRRRCRPRAEIRPDDASALVRRIGRRLHFVFEVGFGGLVGHVDAVALGVELPAVIHAPQARFFVASEEQ